MSEVLTGASNRFPADWSTFSVGEAFEMQLGKMLSKAFKIGKTPKPYLANKNVQWDRVDLSSLETMDFTEAEREKFSLLPGDLLVCEGGEIGRTAMWHGEMTNCYFQKAIHRLRPRTNDVLPEYMLRYMRLAATNGWLVDFMSQSSIAHLTREQFARVPIGIPRPPQQRKIARILTTVDNLIEKTEALIAKYQAIKQGMMHDLFTRGVDEHGHLRPPYEEAPELYKQSELGWIPKEWEVCRVDEVGSVKLGRQRSPKHQSGRFTTPYLRVANVFDGFIDYSDVLEMDFTPREKETYSLLPGDILLNEGQSLELVGRSAIYEGEPHRFCFQNTLIRFRPYTPHDVRFCRGIFKYYIDIGRFMTIARQTTSVAHLGADRLAKLAFPCPHSDEQHRIANALLQHEKRCDLDQAYMNNLLQTKTGLMQDLLTGKVRVKVDEEEDDGKAADAKGQIEDVSTKVS